MNVTAFGQKTNLNLAQFQVQQTRPSEEELKRQVEQLTKEEYQGAKKFSFSIIIAIAIWIIILCAIRLAWH